MINDRRRSDSSEVDLMNNSSLAAVVPKGYSNSHQYSDHGRRNNRYSKDGISAIAAEFGGGRCRQRQHTQEGRQAERKGHANESDGEQRGWIRIIKIIEC